MTDGGRRIAESFCFAPFDIYFAAPSAILHPIPNYLVGTKLEKAAYIT
jgi:hypothetical protein